MTWAAFWSLPSYPLPNVGSFKVISGSVTEVGWGTVMHDFVEYPMGRYPVTLAKRVPKMLLSSTNEHMRQNTWALKSRHQYHVKR
jgi:hypothetical protein